jgi:aryl-alcohol dehydrogenase-like predicted oxidoreductase
LVPIPGTKRRQYLEENVAALNNVKLTQADLMPRGAAAGAR